MMYTRLSYTCMSLAVSTHHASGSKSSAQCHMKSLKSASL